MHLFEYDDENQKIKGAQIFNHPGVVNKIFPNPENELLFFTSYQECNHPGMPDYSQPTNILLDNGVFESNKFSLCSLASTDNLKSEESLKLSSNNLPNIK